MNLFFFNVFGTIQDVNLLNILAILCSSVRFNCGPAGHRTTVSCPLSSLIGRKFVYRFSFLFPHEYLHVILLLSHLVGSAHYHLRLSHCGAQFHVVCVEEFEIYTALHICNRCRDRIVPDLDINAKCCISAASSLSTFKAKSISFFILSISKSLSKSRSLARTPCHPVLVA